MMVTTTDSVEGRQIVEYLGICSGEAIVGVDIDYEVLGKENGMMMVVANGTAVKLG